MNIDDKIANPLRYYHHPSELDLDDSLGCEEKIRLLQNWLDDIRLRMTAESENMPESNHEHYMTREVEDLLRQYQEKIS